ncbi:hypothetical protein FHL15_010815 [Xylaria flabelliformis]|uniref:C2H2-type domain-containing protein n=1 Tax=Xylaria flabelliformis TaxID=2512241 RepID=A0A553HK37_9PEZI|nr:hypothetical protein FHL15_010815 [Xylaria flabelliformis]
MDSRVPQNSFHLGETQESLERTTPSATFTGLVDEFLVFGGPAGFDDQYLSRSSLYEVDIISAANSLPNGSNMLHASRSSVQQTSSNLISSNLCPASLSQPMAVLDLLDGANNDRLTERDEKPRCWEHGCNGREFSSKSNLMRHVKEKSGASNKCTCPLCGAIFTRSSARDTHLAKQSCNKIRRYSNGRPRPSRLAVLENPRAAAVAAAAASSMPHDQIQWQVVDQDVGSFSNMRSAGDTY